MALYPKPAEGSWTEHYPDVGIGTVSYEDCVSPAFYEVEREAVFKRAWLNVGRVEDVPRNGSFLTKELESTSTSRPLVGDVGRVSRQLSRLAAMGFAEIIYTPTGPDPARELQAFASARPR